MSEKDTVLVLAAAYDDVAEAEADYEAIKALYYDVKTSHDFDAAVIDRDQSGKVRVVKKHEQPTRHGAAAGMGWGLAVGAAAGATIGAVTGHVKGGMSNDDLRSLGEVLDNGQAGLVAVYATNMADQVAAGIKAQNMQVSQEIDADADELAKELKAAETSS